MKLLTIILIGLFVFLVLLFVVPIRIICTMKTAGGIDVSLAVQVLFVRLKLLPRKKRLPNLKKFRRDALERLYRKKQKKADRKARAKEKRAAKKAQKQQRATSRSSGAKQGHPKKKRGLRHTIKLIWALTRILLERFGRYLRVDIRALEITVATGDPANTAILYGWVWAAMENFWNLISDTRMFHRVQKSAISIRTDFLAEKPSVRGKIVFSIALWQICAILIAGGTTALAVETEARKRESAEEREARRQSEAAARAEMIRELKK